MSFFIKDKKLLEKYNEIWKKVSKIIKKGCDSNPVYNEKYLKNKLKVYDQKNVNMLLKKKLQYITYDIKIFSDSDTEDSDNSDEKKI